MHTQQIKDVERRRNYILLIINKYGQKWVSTDLIRSIIDTNHTALTRDLKNLEQRGLVDTNRCVTLNNKSLTREMLTTQITEKGREVLEDIPMFLYPEKWRI